MWLDKHQGGWLFTDDWEEDYTSLPPEGPWGKVMAFIFLGVVVALMFIGFGVLLFG